MSPSPIRNFIAIFNNLEPRWYLADMITRRDRERERERQCRVVSVVVPGPGLCVWGYRHGRLSATVVKRLRVREERSGVMRDQWEDGEKSQQNIITAEDDVTEELEQGQRTESVMEVLNLQVFFSLCLAIRAVTSSRPSQFPGVGPEGKSKTTDLPQCPQCPIQPA